MTDRRGAGAAGRPGGGDDLSAYVRACVFAEEATLRKSRPSDVVADKKAAAEALALLG